jgi:hypothetical protein
MNYHQRFRILTPGGRLSRDLFIVADDQPRTLKPDCLVVVHEPSGRQITVHDTRLFPADSSDTKPFSRRMDVCVKCGRVARVPQEQVPCPYGGDVPCSLLEASAQCVHFPGDAHVA